MIEIRQATQENVEQYLGCAPMFSLRGIVAFSDDRPIGIGGVYRENGFLFAFSEIRPEGHKYKKHILKAAKIVVAQMRERYTGESIYAVPDVREESAERFLRHLGFRPVPDKPGLYKWEG